MLARAFLPLACRRPLLARALLVLTRRRPLFARALLVLARRRPLLARLLLLLTRRRLLLARALLVLTRRRSPLARALLLLTRRSPLLASRRSLLARATLIAAPAFSHARFFYSHDDKNYSPHIRQLFKGFNIRPWKAKASWYNAKDRKKLLNSPTLKRTEERAPLGGSEFNSKDAALRGGSAKLLLGWTQNCAICLRGGGDWW